MANVLESILKSLTGTDKRTLPNGGGSYSSEGTAPSPVFLGPTLPVKQTLAPIFKPASTTPAPVYTPQAPAVTLPKEYINPATGKIYTPQEYADNVARSLPISSVKDVANYAGDAITKPDQSSADLANNARKLNNSRNDIATATTDPYDITQGGKIVYSPEERKAIEKAYAGVYDPALQDVFTRLDEKKKKDEKAVAEKQKREDAIFNTNENIRQWKATTGSKGSSSGEDLFTRSQLNDGASKSGLTITTFDSLDNDLKNFFINTPKGVDDEGKKVPINQIFETRLKAVKTKEDADALSADITASTLPEAVKHYFIEQIPATPAQTDSWLQQIWGGIKSIF